MGGRHYRQVPDVTFEDEGRSPLSGPFIPVALVSLALLLLEGVYLVSVLPDVRVVVPVVASCALVVLVAGASLVFSDAPWGRLFVKRVVFPSVLFVVGLSYALFFTPGAVPDEKYHYKFSYAYANALDPGMGPHELREEDYAFMTDNTYLSDVLKTDFWEHQAAGEAPILATREGTREDETLVRTIDIGQNPPQLKLVSGLGILVARTLGLSASATFYAGRVANFLFSVTLIILSVWLAPCGANIMMAVSLLPMSVHLIGSYSYDGGVIGLSFLLTSLVMRVLMGKGQASAGLLVATAVVAVLLAPCKVFYYAIALMALCAPTSRFSSRRAALAFKLAMVLAPLAVILAVRLSKMLSIAGVAASAGDGLNHRGQETGHFYTLGYVLGHPLETAQIFLRTFFENSDSYLNTIVGRSLAYFQPNIAAKDVQVFSLLALLGISAIPAADDCGILPTHARVLGVCLSLVVGVAIMMTMMLSWTFDTEGVIAGFQGRYLLPLLPLFLLCLRGPALTAYMDLAPILAMTLGGLDLLLLAQSAFAVLSAV